MTRAWITIVGLAWLLAWAPGGARALPVRPGLEAGVRLGRLIDDPQFMGSELHPAWSAQGFVEWPGAAGWSVVAGLGYEEVGSVREDALYSNSQLIARSRLHQALGYLTVPVGLQWQPSPGRGAFIRFGPDLGYLERVMGKFKVEFPPAATPPAVRERPASPAAQIFEDPSAFFSSRDPFYPWALFLDASAGWELPAFGHRLHARARWVEGVTDVSRSGDNRRTLRALEMAGGWSW